MLPADSVGDAIVSHGFLSVGKHFETWEELIEFLNAQAINARQALGQEIPEFISAEDIIQVAPIAVLQRFLDQVETDLIPQRLFDRAENFLVALLAGDVISQNPDLGRRAARLLQTSNARKREAEIAITGLTQLDARFTSLGRHCQIETSARVAEAIKERGCVFAPAR